jgi:hypothetical protein
MLYLFIKSKKVLNNVYVILTKMKIMNTLKKLKFILLSFIAISFYSCSNSESGTNAVEKTAPTISVRLVDAPGDFKAVNVEVVDVMIKMDDDNDDDSGWTSLEAENEIINLLDFTGGISKVLVDRFAIPAGTLSQMRLVLGDGNTIVIENDLEEDEEFDLKTPSAQQSGLKLKVNAVIEEGYAYDFILDFDVEKSVVIAGNSGNIILKPVLYVSTEVNSGIIEGTVEPSDVASVVSVLVDDNGTPETDDDFVISANTDANGQFALWGVPAGTYDLMINPDAASVYTQTIVEGVTVVNGETTVIQEAIQLNLKTGDITGKITNEGLSVIASVIVDGSEVTATTDTNGVFLLEGIPIGTYNLTLTPAIGDIITVNDVIVEENMTKDIGEITFP